ncbi:hypothetical protein VNO80_10772 [Phaseolus coccineus]|uniref:DNA2/NAM7 helicase-like C-terminal domain-containing protein n=1 Tax=Phaseolus coccineus TaxID=3886 RepID=A0AAN9N969_PHACN
MFALSLYLQVVHKQCFESSRSATIRGREKDVAIFSCVWASKDKGIGFVEDIRRMNVGITRAKSTVLVAEPSQVIGPTDTVDNDVQPNNAATCDYQAQAEDNDEMMTTWT